MAHKLVTGQEPSHCPLHSTELPAPPAPGPPPAFCRGNVGLTCALSPSVWKVQHTSTDDLCGDGLSGEGCACTGVDPWCSGLSLHGVDDVSETSLHGAQLEGMQGKPTWWPTPTHPPTHPHTHTSSIEPTCDCH